MNPKLEALLGEVQTLPLLSRVSPSEDERNALLDRRDEPEFDTAWSRVHAQVQRIERLQAIGPDDQAVIDTIRETAFKRAYDATGSGELAAYTSDDFDLIARARRLAKPDAWLDALLAQYRGGEFPCAVPA